MSAQLFSVNQQHEALAQHNQVLQQQNAALQADKASLERQLLHQQAERENEVSCAPARMHLPLQGWRDTILL